MQFAPAADAAKKDSEQFKIWREDPAKFSFDGHYPLLEVYDKAKEAWTGTQTCACSACLPACLFVCLPACMSACLPACLPACPSVRLSSYM